MSTASETIVMSRKGCVLLSHPYEACVAISMPYYFSVWRKILEDSRVLMAALVRSAKYVFLVVIKIRKRS